MNPVMTSIGTYSDREQATPYWHNKRNCSISPMQLLGVYLSLVMLSLGIATFFWFKGAQLVMPFAWLELLALGAALFVYARHALDSEEIRLHGECLEITWRDGYQIHRKSLNAAWVRVHYPDTSLHSLLNLSCRGEQVLVGRFLNPTQRVRLAGELRQALGLPRLSVVGALDD